MGATENGQKMMTNAKITLYYVSRYFLENVRFSQYFGSFALLPPVIFRLLFSPPNVPFELIR